MPSEAISNVYQYPVNLIAESIDTPLTHYCLLAPYKMTDTLWIHHHSFRPSTSPHHILLPPHTCEEEAGRAYLKHPLLPVESNSLRWRGKKRSGQEASDI